MKARVAALLILAASELLAIAPRPTPKLCAAYFKSDTVFVGELVNVGYFPPDLDDNYLKYQFRVIQSLRGTPGTMQLVLSHNASARWVGDVGKRYVVFAREGMIWGSGGPLDDPSYVAKVANELAAIRRSTLATVEGDVVRGPGLEPIGAGRRVLLHGIDKSFTATTDSHGQFSFRVPPGQYLLLIDGARPTVYSRGGDEPFKVVAGQCAQFEFEVEK